MDPSHLLIGLAVVLSAAVLVAALSYRKSPVQFISALWVWMTTTAMRLGGAGLAFLYVIWPIDLVPDIIFFFGWLDDLGIVGVGVMLLRRAFRFPNPFRSDAPPDQTKQLRR